ncbi:MAG: 16S rRNA (guanine(527)-N(7))-methyltransferase RsmG [Armatimonadetes bacterium]|nr:16S rRNA (guanine(527)-N(7))-methyltransferase RsmG [Armatimonadota bacterium]
MTTRLARLQSGTTLLGIALAPAALDRFERFLQQLLSWKGRLNLTAATSADELEGLHLLDSLLPLKACVVPPGCRVVDVGSGAGFPGVPMKIVRPDLRIVLVEASRRRVAFLEHLRVALDLPDVEIRWARAEALGREQGFREAFGLAVSRATAHLGATCELTLPLVEPGGAAVLLRGPKVAEEASAASRLVGALGGEVESCSLGTLPTTNRLRAALVLRKQRPTPPEFPRSGRRLGAPPPRKGEGPAAALKHPPEGPCEGSSR